MIHPIQAKIAKKMFNKIKKDRGHLLKDMKYFDFFAIVPLFRSLGEPHQNICRCIIFFFFEKCIVNLFPSRSTNS